MLADLHPTPYWAVIFASVRTEGDKGYGETADRMVELSRSMPGFLGMEHARGADGVGITLCYWSSPEAIAAWKAHVEHRAAQERGVAEWYASFRLRIAKVERDHGFDR